ncbi:MAG: type II toxin-antitoxin system VapC family toxin [Vicinamibacterales bacterium]
MTTRARVRHERGVLDTNTLILLTRIQDETLLPVEPLITTVTLAELSVGPLVAKTDEERAARQSHVQQAEADFDPLPFDVAAARAFGRVALALRASGRAVKPRAYDVMIAATALANRLPLYTCNPKDFTGIDGLTVVSVPVPILPTPSEPRPPRKQRART